MLAPASTLDGGFDEPVFMAQAVFRCVMKAMARPGTRISVPKSVSPPAPLDRTVAAVACTLVDVDAPIWLDSGLAHNDAVRAWLGFHTGVRVASKPDEASFALISEPAVMLPLEAFAQGSQDYPDRSATLVLQLPDLEGGASLTFEGPGIKERVVITPQGLPADFARQWRANRARFPRGVDLILISGDDLICLPRTARLVGTEE